jgi:hypothetical protein
MQAAVPAAAMAPCHEVDTNAAALCIEHCRYGQQSADTASMPAPLAALLTPLYVLPREAHAGCGFAPALRVPVADRVAAPPPHAIVHCVYRI